MECINIECDEIAKELIKEQVAASGSLGLPFVLASLTLETKEKMQLSSTEMITDETCKQTAASCIEKKLNRILIEDIDWEFRKLVTKILSVAQQTWFVKSFTNFIGTAHQPHRQNMLSSDACGVCNEEEERETSHMHWSVSM